MLHIVIAFMPAIAEYRIVIRVILTEIGRKQLADIPDDRFWMLEVCAKHRVIMYHRLLRASGRALRSRRIRIRLELRYAAKRIAVHPVWPKNNSRLPCGCNFRGLGCILYSCFRIDPAIAHPLVHGRQKLLHGRMNRSIFEIAILILAPKHAHVAGLCHMIAEGAN
ncbi:hypothetical protein D3C78_1177640 [compost metagenome]